MGVLCQTFRYLHIGKISCVGTLNMAWWVDEDILRLNSGTYTLITHHR